MTMRIIDPVVPAVARDLSVSVETVALLASAFTFPYALSQPLLGSLGDALGKALIIKICLAVVLVCLVAGAYAPNVEMLFAVRIIGGAAGGGIIPLSFAIVGDRFPFEQRQIALSRVLAAIIAGREVTLSGVLVQTDDVPAMPSMLILVHPQMPRADQTRLQQSLLRFGQTAQGRQFLVASSYHNVVPINPSHLKNLDIYLPELRRLLQK